MHKSLALQILGLIQMFRAFLFGVLIVYMHSNMVLLIAHIELKCVLVTILP
jgi:hypothetical protein